MAGLLGGIGEFLFGKAKQPKQVSTLDPQQRHLFDQYIQGLQGQGGPLGDVFGQFDPQQQRELFQKEYAKPAYENFQQNIVPGITGQFRGNNLQNSSYAGQALANAGRGVQQGLDTNLARILYEAQQGSLNRRHQGANFALGQSTFGFQQPQEDPFQSLLKGLAGSAGNLFGDWGASKLGIPQRQQQQSYGG